MPENQDRDVPVRNRILSALPVEEYARLLPHLEPVSLGHKHRIYAPHQPISHVYFPMSGVFSLLTCMDDGAVVEVATVGYEGMAGLPVFLGTDSTPGQAWAQVPVEAVRMRAEVFTAEVSASRTFTTLLHRYTQGLLTQLAQGAACNRLHTVDQRCARWLLMTHDRARADEFPLTHEFLSQMLVVRRATVTEVAHRLQQAGLIRYQRGRLRIVDRPGLEAVGCACYRIIEAEYERLLA